MTRDRLHFLLLNIGHFLDHLFTLIFATVAALALHREWGVGYAQLLTYATPGFFAFGVFALPAGWLADRWSRDGMMCVFFIGIGLASIVTGFAQTPLQIGIGLFVIGMFAAIYHPVGLAIVTMRWRSMGIRIAANGVWGNLGVASAALITGYLIDHGGWRMAFFLPGIFSIAMGIAYWALRHAEIRSDHAASKSPGATASDEVPIADRAAYVRISAIIFVTIAVGSVIFQSTTFALPKVFDERIQGLAGDVSAWMQGVANADNADVATAIGSLAFLVFAVASLAQLVVGVALDRLGARQVFMIVAIIQLVFFWLMPGTSDLVAFAVALGFMLGAFGQIPIGDFMVGKMASGSHRARIYAVRYVVSFTVLAVSLPMIAFVYANWGFDTLFHILTLAALIILIAVLGLPKRLPEPQAANVPAQ